MASGRWICRRWRAGLRGERMSDLTPQVIEVLNRNEFLAPFISKGFIPYIPEWDAGVDFILLRERNEKCGYSSDLLLKVQLKSRWTVNCKYFGRDIWIAFPEDGEPHTRRWFLMPHDVMVAQGRMLHGETASWHSGHYSKVVSSSSFDQHARFETRNVLRCISNSPLTSFMEGSARTWLSACDEGEAALIAHAGGYLSANESRTSLDRLASAKD